jgi:hypothetical protein
MHVNVIFALILACPLTVGTVTALVMFVVMLVVVLVTAMVMSIASAMFAARIMRMAIVPCHSCQEDSVFKAFALSTSAQSEMSSFLPSQH